MGEEPDSTSSTTSTVSIIIVAVSGAVPIFITMTSASPITSIRGHVVETLAGGCAIRMRRACIPPLVAL